MYTLREAHIYKPLLARPDTGRGPGGYTCDTVIAPAPPRPQASIHLEVRRPREWENLIFQKQGEIRERYRGGRDREKNRLYQVYYNKNDFFKIERYFPEKIFLILFF